jgi:hypothetical protein
MDTNFHLCNSVRDPSDGHLWLVKRFIRTKRFRTASACLIRPADCEAGKSPDQTLAELGMRQKKVGRRLHPSGATQDEGARHNLACENFGGLTSESRNQVIEVTFVSQRRRKSVTRKRHRRRGLAETDSSL